MNVKDLGRVIAAGPIRDAFDGAATGELMRLAPALMWVGIPAAASRYYAGLAYTGGILLIAEVGHQLDCERLERRLEALSAREIYSAEIAQPPIIPV
jgi:hypothetical protein